MSHNSMGNAMLNLSRFRKLTPVLAIIAIAVVFCSPAMPQGNTGRILGTVTDQSGGAVADATVTITDVQRGTSRTLTTDSSGEYVAPGLLPGSYTVRGEAKGFKVFDRRNLLLETGKDLQVDIVLQTGSANEVITVTEEVPLVDATTTTLGGTLSNQIINDLPLNGRNYQNLLTLRPGVMIYPGGGPWTQSTNGTRPESMSFLIDGLPNDEAFMGLSITNAAAVIGDAATLLPVDAIQEFNTQVNPPAEFGWKTGAITSVGLKSGTNELHGSAYAYGRSDAFDARNFFNHYTAGTLQPKIPVSLQQYGGTAGAYIIKDKLFWFGGYEAQTYSVGSNLGITVPTTVGLPGAAGNGCKVLTTGDCVNSIPNAIADIQAQPGAVLNPESLALLGCPTTAPFGPCTGALFGSNHTTGTGLNPTYQNTNDSKNALGKIDYHISERHNLSGSYFFGNDGLVGEDTPYTNSAFLTHVHSRAQAAAGSWAWTPNSSWANEIRFGYTRYTLSITPGDQNVPASMYGLYTGVTNPIIGGLPSIVVGGFTAMGNFFSFPKFVGPDNTYDIIDQVSHTMGKHALKFGFQFRDIQVNQATWRRARGDIRFSSLEDFLEGDVHQLRLLATNSTPAVGSPARSLKQYGYAAFVQDDWRVTQRITLNLGLRYEYTTPPSEAHNLLGNFDPTLGMVQLGTSQLGSIYNGDHTNFAPRVGVAWDVTGKGTTIVRAGFGMAYELLTMNTFLSQQNTNNAPTLGLGVIPTGATIVVNGVATPGSGTIQTTGINFAGSALPNPWPGTPSAPFFPANSTSAVVCGDGSMYQGSPTSPCSILGMDRNYTTPFVSTWSLGVQHAFSGKLSLDANYVGNHGSNLTGIRDVNQPNIQTGAPGAYTTKFPYLGFINMMGNYYRSNYDGLQLTFTGRDYHGFSFIAGYTYAHALDNMSFNWNQYLPQDSLHPGADYASSDFDIRNRFTLSLTYQIPGKDSWGQMLKGWQVNSIITLQSGQPWNVIDYNSTYGFSQSGEGTDRWDFFGNPGDFHSDGTHGIPCFGLGPGTPCPGTIPQACLNAAAKVGPMAVATLTGVGLPASSPTGPTGYCYMVGNSVMIPNAYGAFGTMGRNIFRATGFHNVDFSVTKAWIFAERVNMQFRAEFFNLFNHPNFANPWGGTSGYGPAGGYSDPTVPGNFGCGCATPDVAAVNPVLGSGSARAIQLGLKFTF
jgi:Carboxypeptidase regulatory-like domain/TonB dependent receptor-like, beta-barrel